MVQDQGLGVLDDVGTECLQLEAAPVLLVGFQNQLLVREEVVEQKDPLGSSHPGERKEIINITSRREEIWL